MRLLIYYNANYKCFNVIYSTVRHKSKFTPAVDKYNRMFIQEIDLYGHPENLLDKLKKLVKNRKGIK